MKFNELVRRLQSTDYSGYFSHPPDPVHLAFVFHKMVFVETKRFAQRTGSQKAHHLLDAWLPPQQIELPITKNLRVYPVHFQNGNPQAIFFHPREKHQTKYRDPTKALIEWDFARLQDISTFDEFQLNVLRLWGTAFHECIHLRQYLDSPVEYKEQLRTYPKSEVWRHPLEIEPVAYSNVLSLIRRRYDGEVPRYWGRRGSFEKLTHVDVSSDNMDRVFYFAKMQKGKESRTKNRSFMKQLIEDQTFLDSSAVQGWKLWFGLSTGGGT